MKAILTVHNIASDLVTLVDFKLYNEKANLR
jgi:hypothetical protein